MALLIAARSCAVLGRKVRRYQGMEPYHRRPSCSARSSPESRSLLANDCLSRALRESPSWRPRSGSPINSRIRSSTRPRTNSFNCSIDNDERSMEPEYGQDGRNATSGRRGIVRSLCALNLDGAKHGEFQLPLASLPDTPAFSPERNLVCL